MEALNELRVASSDAVVWIMLATGVFSLASAALLWKEPMNCGGRNTMLHRVLSFVLLGVGINHVNRAFSRLYALSSDSPVLESSAFIMSEILVCIVTTLLAFKLMYDLYNFKELKRLRADTSCDKRGDCPDRRGCPHI